MYHLMHVCILVLFPKNRNCRLMLSMSFGKLFLLQQFNQYKLLRIAVYRLCLFNAGFGDAEVNTLFFLHYCS